LLPESFSVKVKVLGGGFGLWLGDNIAILSMVKRAHLLFLTLTKPLSRVKFEYFRDKLGMVRKDLPRKGE
jgi:hypothetical protein